MNILMRICERPTLCVLVGTAVKLAVQGRSDKRKHACSPSDFSLGMGETPSVFAGGFVRVALRLFLRTH